MRNTHYKREYYRIPLTWSIARDENLLKLRGEGDDKLLLSGHMISVLLDESI